MKVLKFGGTSVGSVDNIRKVKELITDGDKKIVVLSAMSGTTNILVEISENINLGQRVKAFKFEIKVNNKWQTIKRGTTIGSKRLIRFSNNNIQGLRISILDSKDVPLISELGLYSSN